METGVIENLLAVINELRNNLENQIEEINHARQERNQETTEALKLRNELDTTKKILRLKEKELQTALEKIGHFDVRNVNRRIKRMEKKLKDADETINTQDEIILDLSNELLGEKEENENYNCQLNELTEKLDKALKNLLCEQKLKWYYKTKSKNISNDQDEINRSKIKELNDRIRELEDEKLQIEEKLNVFLKGEDVLLFKDGKYIDEIRMVYEDLLCMGVSTRNIEGVIRSVLKTVGVNVGRLPKETFAKYMLFEARALAQLQVADELSENWDTENRTLHTDGTSKKGRSFITYDIVKDDGKCLIAGLREVGGGDSSTQLKVLENVLADVSCTVCLIVLLVKILIF